MSDASTPGAWAPPPGGEFTFADLVNIGWKRRRLVAVVTGVCTVVAVVYALLATPMFTSTAVLVTKVGKQSNTALAQLAALSNMPGSNPQADPSNYLDQVAQDEALLLSAVDRKWVYRGDSVYLWQVWKMKAKSKKDEDLVLMRRVAAKQLGRSVTIAKNLKSGTLTLSCQMPDPVLARDATEYFVSLLDDYVVNRLRTQAAEKARFIEERIADVKDSLERSEGALVAFREKNVVTNMARYRLQESRLLREMTLNQEVYLQLNREYESARIEQKNDQPLIEIVRSPEVPMVKSKPNRRRIAVVGLFCGLLAGLAAAYAFERWVVTPGAASRGASTRPVA